MGHSASGRCLRLPAAGPRHSGTQALRHQGTMLSHPNRRRSLSVWQFHLSRIPPKTSLLHRLSADFRHFAAWFCPFHLFLHVSSRPAVPIPAGEFYFISMDLGYRPLMPPNGLPSHASLLSSGASDFRTTPRMPRPVSAFDLSARNSEPCAMEKIPPVTGKRRGGSRKACNECKQQKVSCLSPSLAFGSIIWRPDVVCTRPLPSM